MGGGPIDEGDDVHARWGRRIARTIATAAVVVFTTLVAAAGLAQAGELPPNAPIVVTTTADVVDAGDGQTSLREAFDLSEAQAGHDEVVLVPNQVHEVTSCGGNDEAVEILDEAGVTITGSHATIDSSCTGRLLDLSQAGPSLIEDVTLTGGSDEEAVWIADGDLEGLTLTGLSDDAGDPSSLVVLDDGAVRGMHIEGTQGFGALLHLFGTMTLAGPSVSADVVTIVDNDAQVGIVGEVGATVGGALVERNTFDGAGIALPSGGRIEQSAVHDNTGPGVSGHGDGEDPLTVINTTIAANHPSDGLAGGIRSEIPVDLLHVTVAENDGVNSAADRWEVQAPSLGAYASIIGARDLDQTCDVEASTSGGSNLASSDCELDHPTDVLVTGSFDLHAPAQETLHGWTTVVVRPRPGSPAIDAIGVAPCALIQRDQRGVPRPQGPGCDIGAYEVQVEFRDVTGNHPFNREVTWAQQENIVNGYPDHTYRPGVAVSRGAMAAFLHRFAGNHDPTFPIAPTFSDVGRYHPFAEDVAWLVQQGITGGYEDGTYRPAAPVSRGAMAAFLYRMTSDDPVVLPDPLTFSDVTATHPFVDEIEWLAGSGIAGGYQDGTYRPTAPVSRGAMAAFLYRLAELD
jgi:hypothetical protein